MQKRVTRGFGNVCRIVEISPQNAPKIIFNQNKDNKKIQLDMSILEENFLLVLFEMICWWSAEILKKFRDWVSEAN